jgi:hypothetical protein
VQVEIDVDARLREQRRLLRGYTKRTGVTLEQLAQAVADDRDGVLRGAFLYGAFAAMAGLHPGTRARDNALAGRGPQLHDYLSSVLDLE